VRPLVKLGVTGRASVLGADRRGFRSCESMSLLRFVKIGPPRNLSIRRRLFTKNRGDVKELVNDRSPHFNPSDRSVVRYSRQDCACDRDSCRRQSHD
jgi:hypothetical protein